MYINNNHSAISAYGRTVIGGGSGSNRLAVDFSILMHERLADVMSKGSKLDNKKKSDDNEDLFTKIWGPNGMIETARERFAAMRKDTQDIPEKRADDVTASEPENEDGNHNLKPASTKSALLEVKDFLNMNSL